MDEHEDVGTADVQVQRSNADNDTDRSGHQNWVFKEKSYWDERFTGEKEYDWLTGFAGIEVLLRKHVRTSDRILVVGCGNSTLSRDMYDSGFTQLTNLDFSAVVIDAMAAQHANCGPTMRWVVGDMMDMKDIADGSFDVVLDKAAMDALLVDEGDVWNPRPQCLRDADRALSEFSRVLRPGGKLVQVTFAQPHFRRKYLDKPTYNWDILQHETVAEGLGYFFYTCVKREGVQRQPESEESAALARAEAISLVDKAPAVASAAAAGERGRDCVAVGVAGAGLIAVILGLRQLRWRDGFC